MYKRHNGQLSLYESPELFGGLPLNPENDWVKLGQMLPWDAIEDCYLQEQPEEKNGQPATDGETHRPIAILEGRDGISLKEWIQDHKHVKVVTRDRASAYAKAISEELPNAMQIADRFHLHQNLLDAIKKALKSELPNSIPVEKPPDEDSGKKRVTLVG